MKTIVQRALLLALCVLLLLGTTACGDEPGGVSPGKASSRPASSQAASQAAEPVSGEPVADTVAYRPASANKQVKNLKILPVGDSLTNGDGTLSGWRYQGYRALYAAGITFEFVGPYTSGNRDKRMPERYARHAGVGGWKIENILNKKEEIFNRDFDVVVMMIGFNDGALANSALAQNNYRAIFDYVYQRNADAVVFCLGVAPSYYNVEQGVCTHTGFNEKVAGLCEEYTAAGKRAYYVDTWDSEEWDKDSCFGDTVHFNEKGNAIIASCLAKVALPVLREMNVADTSYTLPLSPTGITLDKSSVSLAAHDSFGEGVQLNATVAPANAEVASVVWGSSDRRVATVDENGVVRAVGAGACTVTAYTFDGGIAATCAVTVTAEGGDSLVFDDNMKAAAAWTGGNDAFFKNGKYYGNAIDPDPVTSVKTVAATDRFFLSLNTRNYCFNGSLADQVQNGLFTLSLGDLKLRITGIGYACAVLLGDTVVCQYIHGNYCVDRVEYGLLYDRGKVTLTRNGAPVASGTCAAQRFSGNIVFHNQNPNRVLIRSIRVSAW